MIDNETFPGATESAWRKKCDGVAAQLAAYADVLASRDKRVIGRWVHLPVGGGMVELASGDATNRSGQ